MRFKNYEEKRFEVRMCLIEQETLRWGTFEIQSDPHIELAILIESRFLPLRTTPEQAEQDLICYAKNKGWERDGISQ